MFENMPLGEPSRVPIPLHTSQPEPDPLEALEEPSVAPAGASLGGGAEATGGFPGGEGDILGDIMKVEFTGKDYFIEDFVEKNDKVTKENLDHEDECVSEKLRSVRLVAGHDVMSRMRHDDRKASPSFKKDLMKPRAGLPEVRGLALRSVQAFPEEDAWLIKTMSLSDVVATFSWTASWNGGEANCEDSEKDVSAINREIGMGCDRMVISDVNCNVNYNVEKADAPILWVIWDTDHGERTLRSSAVMGGGPGFEAGLLSCVLEQWKTSKAQEKIETIKCYVNEILVGWRKEDLQKNEELDLVYKIPLAVIYEADTLKLAWKYTFEVSN